MSEGNMWLSGGREGDNNFVKNRDMSEQKMSPSNYQWIVRSSANGITDLLDGCCVHYNAPIYLGIRSDENNLWLTTGLTDDDGDVTSYGQGNFAQIDTDPWPPSAEWTVSSHIVNEPSLPLSKEQVIYGDIIYLQNRDPIGWLKGLGGRANGGVGKVKIDDALNKGRPRNTADWYQWTVQETTSSVGQYVAYFNNSKKNVKATNPTPNNINNNKVKSKSKITKASPSRSSTRQPKTQCNSGGNKNK